MEMGRREVIERQRVDRIGTGGMGRGWGRGGNGGGDWKGMEEG